MNAGKTLLDRPLTERENQHARQVSDAGKEIDERERTGIAGFFEDAPVQPYEEHENRSEYPEIDDEETREKARADGRVVIHVKPPEDGVRERGEGSPRARTVPPA